MTGLSVKLDGNTTNMSMVTSWMTTTLKNICRIVVAINIMDTISTHLAVVDLVTEDIVMSDTVDTHLAVVDLMTEDVVMSSTETVHKTDPGSKDIIVIVNTTAVSPVYTLYNITALFSV